MSSSISSFAETDDIFIKALVRVLRPEVLLRGDCIFRMNEPGDSMYFIQNGCMQMTNLDRSVVFVTLMPGAYFGELAMLTSQRRTATAQAICDCILFSMKAADFDEVIKDFPRYHARAHTAAWLTAAVPPRPRLRLWLVPLTAHSADQLLEPDAPCDPASSGALSHVSPRSLHLYAGITT